jgi:hypothetical protein
MHAPRELRRQMSRKLGEEIDAYRRSQRLCSVVVLLAMLGLALLASGSLFAPVAGGALSGTVTDASGDPVIPNEEAHLLGGPGAPIGTWGQLTATSTTAREIQCALSSVASARRRTGRAKE